MKLGNFEIGNIWLAPMAGVTDVGFRYLAKKYGAGLTCTELISAKGLIYSPNSCLHLLARNKNEKPMSVQLFGHEPEFFVKAINHTLLKDFEIIDINMGCPAPKIVKNGDGSALLNNLPLARQIIRACVKATNRPITIKTRIGFKNGERQCLELAKIAEEEGAKAITIHGRTKESGYSGEIDYETIKKVKQSISIPVIGNGGCRDKETFDKMWATGVDAIMIGQACFGNPWLFSNRIIDWKTKLKDINNHINILQKVLPDKVVITDMRKHLLWYAKDIQGASEVRRKIALSNDLNQSLNILEELFKKRQDNK